MVLMESKARYGCAGRGAFCSLLVPVARFWGVATAVVMCGVGVEMAVYRHIAGIYILFASIMVFFLEIMWAITLFIELYTNHLEYGRCLRCWDSVSCLTPLRRCPLYLLLSLVLLLWPRWLWLARAAGAMLLVLAALHALLHVGRAHAPHDQHHHLVADNASDCGQDRFDDLTEVVDDSFPNSASKPNNGGSSGSPSLNDQETILEI